MLDKAGVEIGKTYGGLANYGRSYKLSSSSCTGVWRPFSGGSKKGPITDTAGVFALPEIDDIASWTTKGKRWTDDQSQCDFMIYDSNIIVAWPKAGQRTAMEDMFYHSGLKKSVLWAGNYFKHNINYYNNDVKNVNISSNFNNTYYLNHEFDISNSDIVSKICNLKGETIDWESCIYSKINKYIQYPDDLYKEYMNN